MDGRDGDVSVVLRNARGDAPRVEGEMMRAPRYGVARLSKYKEAGGHTALVESPPNRIRVSVQFRKYDS